MRRPSPRWLPLLLLLVPLVGCAGGPYGRAVHAAAVGDYDRAVPLFRDEIRRHPASSDAWCELGVACYHQGEQAEAVEALDQANRISPNARAHLFLGIMRESAGDLDAAAESYRTALALDPGRQTARLLRAHLQGVEQQRVQAEVRQAIANERNLAASTLPANTVAVYPFDSSGLPADMAPLGKGLAELTALDLSKVKALKVVERVRVETLLKELSLGTQKAVQRATAPRVGRLVGGRHIVTGTLSGLPDRHFQLRGGLVDARDSTAVDAQTRDGELTRFFDVQKGFIIQLVEDLGRQLHFELTREERDAIQQHPTENLWALLAYSHGLDRLDAGDLSAAESQFTRAATLDPRFQAAGLRAAQMSELLSARRDFHAGTLSEFASAADQESGKAEQDAGLGSFQADASQSLGLIPPDDDGYYHGSPDNPTVFHAAGLTNVTVRGHLDH